MSHVPALTTAANTAKSLIAAGDYVKAAQGLNFYIDSLGGTDKGEATIGGDAYDLLVAAAEQLTEENDGEGDPAGYVYAMELLDDVLATAKA